MPSSPLFKPNIPDGYTLHSLEQTDSTNEHLFRLASQGAPHQTVLVADRQTAGKGSRGRQFFSPSGGLYFSILLYQLPLPPTCLTPLTALAVYRALRPYTDRALSIKWVNDIYLEGKKLCGILCESRFVGRERTSVVGVGINLVPQDFPRDLRHPAAVLRDTADASLRGEILQAFLWEFDRLLKRPDGLIEEYKKVCCTLGRTVCLQRGEEIIRGQAVDIDPSGALVIALPDGRQKAFSSGEITTQI